MRRALLFALLLAVPAIAEEPREWLVAGPIKGKGRALVSSDPLLEMMFGGATPAYPKKGDKLGALDWVTMTADEKGFIEGDALTPGAAYTVVTSDADRVAMLWCPGASFVYVNGVPYGADVYNAETEGVPVLLRKGANDVVCRAGRGQLSLAVTDPPAPVFLLEKDSTLPWRVDGKNMGKWGAIPVVNATNAWVRGATLEYGKVKAPLPPLAPLTIYKAPFVVGKGEETTVAVVFEGKRFERAQKLYEQVPGRGFQRTFRSAIDNSVQEYGELLPANFDKSKEYALILSLHGAGVGAAGQACAYAPREGFAVAAPTNRRAFGFNWEDWGRLDGLEVLAQAQKDLHIDPSRIILSGHSMGGHGAWHFATTYPDRWSCVAPSAAWISLWTYGSTPRDPAADYAQLFRASASPGDVMGLVRNLDGLPVYILHGTADDTVPIAQAELMVEALKTFHHNWRFVPIEGKPHWWDADAPGTDCLELPDMVDWMMRQRRPDEQIEWAFRTFSPAVSSECRGVTVVAQKKPYAMSKVVAKEDADGKRVFETENVAHLKVAKPAEFFLDGQPLKAGEYALGADGKWAAGAPAGLRKTPDLQGPFPQAFQKPFLFVLPTAGDAAETADALARARFDAEVWWYRGNGRAWIVEDREVTEKDWQERNLVLLGSADTNLCWKKIADRLPFRASAGEMKIGEDVLKGDLALAAVYPNPENPSRLVAVIGATSAAGRRGWQALGWWGSDVGAPDLLCWEPDAVTKWTASFRVVGYFGADWKPATGMWDVKR